MKMRAPSVPLITIDPYFSVWSPADELNSATTVHWTGSPNTINAYALIDGEAYAVIGNGSGKKLSQKNLEINALTTDYIFEGAGIKLSLGFMSTLFPSDLKLMSRPVSFMRACFVSTDGKEHDVSFKIEVSEEICLDKAGEHPIDGKIIVMRDGHYAARIGSAVQNILNRSGDDLRIDWGYFYLSCDNTAASYSIDEHDGMTYASIETPVGQSFVYFAFAYDDIYSINYFGTQLKSLWNKNGEKIEDAIVSGLYDAKELWSRARGFSDALYESAEKAGGTEYAELLSLAYRQAIAAHKLVVDSDGELLFISKECFSNGCAATVDVSYPSIPLFLYYNPELVRAMMRPIYKYATSDKWCYEFAPHDVGQYPLVCGQVYAGNRLEYQMPVEECGNMIVMEACAAIASGSADFAMSHFELLEKWCKYLIENGNDPGNQLCTDDFAGHLAHNCNLALKAIMGIMGMSVLCDMADMPQESEKYKGIATDMAEKWCINAANGDGSYKLAFDQPDTFSMKYNAIWDKLWGTGLFPSDVIKSEFDSYKKHTNKYGLPLDNRADYTKSDWLLWTATFAETKEEFEKFISPLWLAYNDTPNRVPMTDWYFTSDSKLRGFIHRSVIAGLFIKLLHESGKMKISE